MANKLIDKEFLGKYKIIKLIGRGGMNSEVYLAENLNFNSNDHFSEKHKYAAIKLINKTSDTTADHWNRILDEGVTNARLSQSNDIVKLYEIHQLNKDEIVLIMEYIDGPSLKTLIRERSCLSLPETLYIFKKILLGVADMHSKDRVIIHRDLKPENIMFSSDLLDVKIADFGISSVLVQNDNDVDALTNETSFFGTIPYVTPDSTTMYKTINGNKMPIITKQYDFHALGIILYEMLIGEKPFDIKDENDTSIISYWLKYDIIPIKYINPEIRNEIENIFLKLTASKENYKHLRYKDVSEIIDDISRVEQKISNNEKEDQTLIPYDKRIYQKTNFFSNIEIHSFSIKKFLKSNLWFSISLSLFSILMILLIVFIPLGVHKW